MADGLTTLFTTAEPERSAPRAWLAALLSAVVPGTGQLYSGHPLRGAVISILALAWPALVLLALTSAGSRAARMAGLAMAVLLFALCPAIDAWHVSRNPESEPPRPARRWYVLAAYVAAMLFLVRPLVVSPLMKRLVQVYTVDGQAMSLTMQSGDRVVATPLRGAVRRRMVVAWRTKAGILATHRVVGMPGDRLEMRNFMLLVNGLDVEGSALRPARLVLVPGEEFAWQREFLTDDAPRRGYSPTYGDWGPIRVPADHYFVLGDNRYGSLDSRQQGFVSREQIVSRVRWIFVGNNPRTNEPEIDRVGVDVQ